MTFICIIVSIPHIDLFDYDYYAKVTSSINNQTPQNSTDNLTNNSSPKQTNVDLPTSLHIPKININATIEYVGLTSDGAMDIPKNPDQVAWYELGPRPGDNGNAVIAGHHGHWKNGDGSVFDNLDSLESGDTLYIKDKKGTTITFVVQKSEILDPNSDASEVFVSNDGKSHLNLITCIGKWDEISQTYSKRLVVYTNKK